MKTLVRALPALAGVATLLMGLRYFFGRMPLAYHRRLLGQDLESLPAGVASLYATQTRSLGAAFLAIGASNLVLAWRASASRDRHVLLTLNAVFWGGLVVSNARNGLDSPWWMNALVLAMVVPSAFSRPAESKVLT